MRKAPAPPAGQPDSSSPAPPPPFSENVAVEETPVGDGIGRAVDPDRSGGPETGHPVSRMRICVFDDYMKSDAGKNIVTTSNAIFNRTLGEFDQLAIHVVAGDPVVGGTQPLNLDVQIQHSADGVNWIDKRTSPEVPVKTILTSSSGVKQTTLLLPGYDDGTMPSLAFVRLRLHLQTSGTGSAAPVSAKIKIYVTCNDRHEQTFISSQKAKWRKHVEKVKKEAEAKVKAAEAAVQGKIAGIAHQAKVRACAEHWIALDAKIKYAEIHPVSENVVEARLEQSRYEAKCGKEGVGLDELMAEVRRLRGHGKGGRS